MDSILTLIPIGVLGFVVVQGSSLNLTSNGYMSRTYTNAIKGMACIIIMYVHISDEYVNPIQDIIGSFAYVGVFAFFAISAFGCRSSIEKNPGYLNNFWKKRILALFVPAILINLINFFLKLVILNIPDIRVLYAFNQYIYAIIVAYFVFWLVWKVEVIPETIKDFLVGMICLSFSLITYLSPVKLFFIWPTESVGFVCGLLLYHQKNLLTNQLNHNHTIKTVIIFLLSIVLGILYLRFKLVFFIGGYILRAILAGILLLLFSAITMKISFEGKFIQILGNSSYEFYLAHLVVISLVGRMLQEVSSGVFIILVAIITVVMSVLISQISNSIVQAILKIGEK